MARTRLLTILLTGLAVLAAPALLAQETAGDAQTAATPDADADTDAAPVPQTMAEIEQAWAAGAFEAVRAGLKRLAEQEGSALAQYRYARVLLEGRGGPRDNDGAQAWLEKAVAQNHLPAHVLLARMLLQPRASDAGEVPADPARAAGLLKNAAARGNAEAQYYLGLLYRAGRGVEQDMTEAFTWLLAAGEQQYGPAAYELARAYSRGEGVETSDAEAIRWLTAAAEADVVEAQFFLAEAYRLGRGTAEDKPQAVRWYKRAAGGGHVLSARMVGTAYLTGDGVAQDYAEAFRWLEAAARAGEAGAQTNLGAIYAGGLGVEKDDAAAAIWYGRAADQGVPQATMVFAAMLEEGRGIDADPARALRLYRELADKGYGPAVARLGDMAVRGALSGRVAPQTAVPWVAALLSGAAGDAAEGAAEDATGGESGAAAARGWLEAQARQDNRPAQAALGLWLADNGEAAAAAEWLSVAAEAGDVASQARLGQMLITGDGVPLDYVAAHKWLNIAATGGHGAAPGLRATVTELMTPEEVARAQDAARAWLAGAAARAPQTDQVVRQDDPDSGNRP